MNRLSITVVILFFTLPIFGQQAITLQECYELAIVNYPLAKQTQLLEAQNQLDAVIIQLLILVLQRKTKRRWAYFNMLSMIRFHLMTYIDLFKFLENPSKQWLELITKPPDKQLTLF